MICLHVCLCTWYWKRPVWDPLWLELQTVLSYHEEARNQTRVSQMSSFAHWIFHLIAWIWSLRMWFVQLSRTLHCAYTHHTLFKHFPIVVLFTWFASFCPYKWCSNGLYVELFLRVLLIEEKRLGNYPQCQCPSAHLQNLLLDVPGRGGTYRGLPLSWGEGEGLVGEGLVWVGLGEKGGGRDGAVNRIHELIN